MGIGYWVLGIGESADDGASADSPQRPTPNAQYQIPAFALVAALTFAASLALLLGFLFGRTPRTTLPPNRLIVTVLNVGQGESAWIRTPQGKIILLGGGPPQAGKEVADSLRDAGASAVDLLLLPYPYAEAIGGLPDALKNVTVKQAVEPGGTDINQWQKQVRALLEEKRVPVKIARAGQIWEMDGVRVEILAPGEPLLNAAPVAANNSLVVRLVYGKTRFLFAGGIEKAGEAALLTRAPDLSADWLRVAHFGTRAASTPELLRLVSPHILVLSVGPNPDNLPHPETLARLTATAQNSTAPTPNSPPSAL